MVEMVSVTSRPPAPCSLAAFTHSFLVGRRPRESATEARRRRRESRSGSERRSGSSWMVSIHDARSVSPHISTRFLRSDLDSEIARASGSFQAPKEVVIWMAPTARSRASSPSMGNAGLVEIRASGRSAITIKKRTMTPTIAAGHIQFSAIQAMMASTSILIAVVCPFVAKKIGRERDWTGARRSPELICTTVRSSYERTFHYFLTPLR